MNVASARQYSRHVSLSCALAPLPRWMRARAALALLAVLRGVPDQLVNQELDNIIEALGTNRLLTYILTDILTL